MFSIIVLLAFQQAPVQGIVRDSLSGQPVAYALVTSVGAAGRLTQGSTDEHGAFVLRPSADSGKLSVSAPGFHEWSKRCPCSGPTLLVLLQPDPLPAAPIRAMAAPSRLAAVGGSAVVDTTVFRSLPKVLETDVLRAATFAPLATSISDFAAMPAVRGGTAEGVPVFLDGVRLFNPFHLAGFMSAITAETVDHLVITSASGGSGLRQGAVSGAIDVVTRDGARDRVRASGAVGFASARATVEGPVTRGTTMLLDVRRTYLDALTWVLARNGVIDRRVPYSFMDAHAKFNADLGGIRRMSVTGYTSGEGLGDIDSSDREVLASRWSTRAVGVNYRRDVGRSLVADVSAGASAFRSAFLVSEAGESPELDAKGSMQDSRLEARVSWYLAPSIVIAGGAFTGSFSSSDSVIVAPGGDIAEMVQPIMSRGWRGRYGALAELGLGNPQGTGGTLGARLESWPRVGTRIAPTVHLRLSTAPGLLHVEAAQSYQELHSLRNEESRYASYISYDLLVPVQPGTPLLRSRELAFGLHREAPSYAVDLGGYVASVRGLRLMPLGDTPLFSQALIAPDSQKIGSGSGWGVESAVRASRGSWLIMGHYTFSHVLRHVGSEEYVPRFTRAHQGGLLVRWAGTRSNVSANLVFQSGAPYTPVRAVLPFMRHELSPNLPGTDPQIPMGWIGVGGSYNSGRLPSYKRLDVSWTRQGVLSILGHRVAVQPYAAVLNVFGARNVLAADLTRGSALDARPTLTYLPQLQVLPFAGLEWHF